MFTYLVFAGSDYYPSGGWGDYETSYHTKAEAVAHAAGRIEEWGEWAHVVHNGKIIWENGADK